VVDLLVVMPDVIANHMIKTVACALASDGSAAHGKFRLMLLSSDSDMIHGFPLRSIRCKRTGDWVSV